MTLTDVKKANPEFFNEDVSSSYRDDEYEILPSDDGPVLRITSALGTRPIYKIDKDTLELSYLKHDTDIPLFETEPDPEPEMSEADAG